MSASSKDSSYKPLLLIMLLIIVLVVVVCWFCYPSSGSDGNSCDKKECGIGQCSNSRVAQQVVSRRQREKSCLSPVACPETERVWHKWAENKKCDDGSLSI